MRTRGRSLGRASALAVAVGIWASGPALGFDEVLLDEFEGGSLDATRWLVAFRQWGGSGVNGGVVPQNVRVENGTLVLEAHGDRYTGPILGINKDYSPRADGTRVGGAIATRRAFASGRYEVRMKVCPRFGAASAIWAFHYQEYYPGDPAYVPPGSYYAINHEIDIEMPGRPGAPHKGISFDQALLNTWIGERAGESTVVYEDLGAPQDDGQFHTYRFDWHTGSASEVKRVEFYVDDVLQHTTYTTVPENASRLWIGVWFPDGWAGDPDFDTDVMTVDWVKITPFHEEGDRWFPETYPHDGWSDLDPKPAPGGFFEDFDGRALDPGRWKVAKRTWGGQRGAVMSFSGGVASENVFLEDGHLVLEAHGNRFDGTPIGHNEDGSLRTDGRRVGAAIATASYFGSGRFEARMKVAPKLGAASTMWTLHYQELYPGDPGYKGNGDFYAVRHEIDLELPGRPAQPAAGIAFDHALFTTRLGELPGEFTTHFADLGAAQDDGQFHTYRLDWHTGDAGETPRVEFYVDDALHHTSFAHVPTNAGRLFLGVWFPQDWAGTPHFEEARMRVDWVRVTPFAEAGDTWVIETFPLRGWAEYDEFPVPAPPAPRR